MFEEVGKEIGCKLGEFIEVDKWSWQVDQAKFMRIRVNLSIDKPLRRGAHITNAKGERFWVNFKYEKLPTFCFICGKLGHNDKHYTQNLTGQLTNRQYSEWIRVGGQSKGSADKASFTSNKSHESMGEEGMELRPRMVPRTRDTFVQTMGNGNETRTRGQDLGDTNVDMTDNFQLDLLGGWDNMEKVEQVLIQEKGTPAEQNGTKPKLVKELFKSNGDTYSVVGQSQKPSTKTYEVTSPAKPGSAITEDRKKKVLELGPDKEKKVKGKGKWKKVAKKVAREKDKSQNVDMEAQVSIEGKKRVGFIEGLEESKGRTQKRFCELHISNEKESIKILAMAIIREQ